MTDYAMMVDGAWKPVRPQPVTVGETQYPRAIFSNWTDEQKRALGIYPIEYGQIPEGQRAQDWTYEQQGDVIIATPDLVEVAPEPVRVTPEQLADMLFPHADDGAGLVVGRYYEAGRTVVVDGDAYDVIQPFLYANAEWQPEHLRAHLVLRVESGDAWVQPAGGHDAYAAGAIVVHNGATWENTHGDGNVWEPGVFGWAEIIE